MCLRTGAGYVGDRPEAAVICVDAGSSREVSAGRRKSSLSGCALADPMQQRLRGQIYLHGTLLLLALGAGGGGWPGAASEVISRMEEMARKAALASSTRLTGWVGGNTPAKNQPCCPAHQARVISSVPDAAALRSHAL